MYEGACVDYITRTCAQVPVSAHLHTHDKWVVVCIVVHRDCHRRGIISIIETIIIGKLPSITNQKIWWKCVMIFVLSCSTPTFERIACWYVFMCLFVSSAGGVVWGGVWLYDCMDLCGRINKSDATTIFGTGFFVWD